MKCYVFVHRKLSGIQAGIQALHAVAELSQKTHCDGEFAGWAQDHKTVVLLDGGNCSDLANIAREIGYHNVPVGIFEEEDLGNQVTAVAMVADNDVIEATEYLKDCNEVGATRHDGDYLMYNGKLDLAEYLMSFRTHRG